MAHELDFRANGTAAMFSVNATPWHREGVVLTEAPATVDAALAQAGLDWTVDLKPAYQHLDANDDYLEVPDTKLVTRSDRDTVLGVVGKVFRPLQNADAFGVLQPLIDNGQATWETAGALRGGRQVWGMVKFNLDSPVVQEVFASEIVPFGLISNAHDGSRKVTLRETPIRVVCANTLGMAETSGGKHLSVRHTVSVQSRTVDAATALWKGLVERYEAVAQQYKLLKDTHLDTELFRKIVLDTALPIPQRAQFTGESGAKRFSMAADRNDDRRRALTRLWSTGKGHTGNQSAWEAYNALTQAIDHGDRDIFPSSTRLQSIFDGRLGDLKQTVLNDLVLVAATGGAN